MSIYEQINKIWYVLAYNGLLVTFKKEAPDTGGNNVDQNKLFP